MPSAAGQPQEMTSLDWAIDSVRRGLFGLALVLLRKMTPTTYVMIALEVIDFFQMIALPLQSAVWDGTPLYPLSFVLRYLVALFQARSAVLFQAALGVAAAWATVYVGLSLHVTRNFLIDAPQQEGELRALRVIAGLSVGILNMPLTTVLLRGLDCSEDPEASWVLTGLDCSGVERVLLSLFLALLLLANVLLSAFMSAMFVERNPASPSWESRKHGRMTALMIGAKLALSVLFSFNGGTVDWFALAVLALVGVGWAWLTVRWLVYYHVWINSLEFCFAVGFLWCTAITALAQGMGGKETYLLVYFGLPLVMGLSFFGMERYLQRMLSRPLDDVTGMHELATWASSRLVKRAELFRSGELGVREGEADGGEGGGEHSGGGGSSTYGGGGGGATAGIDTHEAERMERARQLLDEADAAFRRMVTLHSERELAFVMAASYFETHSRYIYQEANSLAMSLRRAPLMDTRFHVYRRSRMMAQSDGSGMSPLDRIIFEQKMRETATLRVAAHRTLAALWKALSEPVPDVADVHQAAGDLFRSMQRTDRLFADLMALNGESPQVLRAYADHLIRLKNERPRAQELLNKADRVAEMNQRNQSRVLHHFVFGAMRPGDRGASTLEEGGTTIVVSGFASNLGEILQISQGSLKLFGYSSTSQLLGQNINVLVPIPCRDFHDALMLKFGRRRSSNVINKKRLVVAERRDGTLVPLWLSVWEAPPDYNTCEPRFMASFMELQAEEEIIIFAAAANDFRLYAGTPGALRMLGLDVDTARTEHPSLLAWFPSLDPSFDGQEVDLSHHQVQWLRHFAAQTEISPTLGHSLAQSVSLHRAANQEDADDLGSVLGGMGAGVPAGGAGGGGGGGGGVLRRSASHASVTIKGGMAAQLAADAIKSHATSLERSALAAAAIAERHGAIAVQVPPLLSLNLPGLIPVLDTSIQAGTEGRGSVARPSQQDPDGEDDGGSVDTGGHATPAAADDTADAPQLESRTDRKAAARTRAEGPGSDGADERQSDESDDQDRYSVALGAVQYVNFAPYEPFYVLTIRPMDDESRLRGEMARSGRRRGSIDATGNPLATAAAATATHKPSAAKPAAPPPPPSALGRRRRNSDVQRAVAPRDRERVSFSHIHHAPDRDEPDDRPDSPLGEAGSAPHHTPAAAAAAAAASSSSSSSAVAANTEGPAGTPFPSIPPSIVPPAVPRGPSEMTSSTSLEAPGGGGRAGAAANARGPGAAAGAMLQSTESDAAPHVARAVTPRRASGNTTSHAMSEVVQAAKAASQLHQRSAHPLGDTTTGDRFGGGGDAHDDARSQASTGTSVGAVQRALGGIPPRNEPEVGRIRAVLIGIMVAVLLLAVALTVAMDQTRLAIQDVLQGLERATVRADSAAAAWTALVRLAARQSAWPARDFALQPLARTSAAVPESYASILEDEAAAFRDMNRLLFVSGAKGGEEASRFETDEVVVADASVIPGLADGRDPAWDAAQGDEHVTARLTFTDLGDFIASAMARAARTPENVTALATETLLVGRNMDRWWAVHERSLALRFRDVQALFASVVLAWVVAGSVYFLIAVLLSSSALAWAVRSLGVRSDAIASTFLHVSTRVARAAHLISSSQLARVMGAQHAGMREKGEADGAGGAGAHRYVLSSAFAGEGTSGVEGDVGEDDESDGDDERLLLAEEEAQESLQRALRHHRRQADAYAGDAVHDDLGDGGLAAGGGAQPPRKAVNTRHFVTRTLSLLILPVVFVFAFLASIFVWQILSYNGLLADSMRLGALGTVSGHLAALDAHLAVAAFAPLSLPLRLDAGNRSKDDGAEAVATARAILLGGSIQSFPPGLELGELRSRGSTYRMLAENACSASDAVGGARSDACHALASGLLSDGAIVAAESVARQANIVGRAAIASTNGSVAFALPGSSAFPGDVAPDAVVDKLLVVEAAITPHLSQAFRRARASEADGMRRSLDQTRQFVVIYAWVFAFVFAVATWFVYWPITTSLGSIITAELRLLALIPPELVDGLPALRSDLRRIAADAHLANAFASKPRIGLAKAARCSFCCCTCPCRPCSTLCEPRARVGADSRAAFFE